MFERAIANTKFTPDIARPLWEAWARYEYQYGNLEAAIKLEKRMAEAYPNGNVQSFEEVVLTDENLGSRSSYQTIRPTPLIPQNRRDRKQRPWILGNA